MSHNPSDCKFCFIFQKWMAINFIVHKISTVWKIDLYYLDVKINIVTVYMRIVTGTSVSVMVMQTWNLIKKDHTLKPTKIKLKSYAENGIPAKGQIQVSKKV